MAMFVGDGDYLPPTPLRFPSTVTVEASAPLSTELRCWIFGKNPNGPKSIQKSWHILEGYFPTCKPSRYTKQNLRLLTITTSNGFGIGPSSTEIGGG